MLPFGNIHTSDTITYQKVLKYSEIKLNWRIQITLQNPVVFGARPPLNILAPGISKASVQNSQHFKKINGRLENLNILQL